MNIGIISSGTESLALFRFLNRYNHSYTIYHDQLHRPYGAKNFETNVTFIQEGIKNLQKNNVEKIILPPVYELHFLQNGTKEEKNLILPLFQTYLREYCFSHSLIGKLGIFGDFADIQKAKSLIINETQTYSPTESQKATKRFHFPFLYREKEVNLRKYFLTTFSYSHPMLNKVVKFDLRYFKDAMIDTAIPLNYSYFYLEKTIGSFFNFKKIRFHRMDKLETTFQNLTNQKESEASTINIISTDHNEFLLREKRLLRLLQRGNEIKINFETEGK